jgi:hypothetical protein
MMVAGSMCDEPRTRHWVLGVRTQVRSTSIVGTTSLFDSAHQLVDLGSQHAGGEGYVGFGERLLVVEKWPRWIFEQDELEHHSVTPGDECLYLQGHLCVDDVLLFRSAVSDTRLEAGPGLVL